MTAALRDTHAASHDHFVGFYDHDDDLVAAITSFLGEALDADGSVVVIASPAHRAAIEVELAGRGLRVDALRRCGHYRALDARDTLARFMRDGVPDPARFTSAIAPTLDALTEGAVSLRLFGEMVDLLWQDGNVTGAIELESLWNDLAAHHTFSLYCAYRTASIDRVGDLAAAKRVCDRHTRVVPIERVSGTDDRAPTSPARADRIARVFFPAPSALRLVRRFVRDALAASGCEPCFEDAAVIASELATNAIIHARSPFRVTVSRTGTSLRISLRDASPAMPSQLRPADRDTGGRGISLVAALAARWGTQAEPDGKTVWAEFDTAR